MSERSTRRIWSLLAVSLLVVAGLIAALVFLGGGGAVTPEAAMPSPEFVEITGQSGIDHVYDGDFEFFVGGGVAVFDCNDDERPDVYLAGGTNAAGLYVNESSADIRFAKRDDATTDMTEVLGAYPLDIDSDQITDLMVLRLGENVVLRGLGGCRFERANEVWGIDGGNEWTAAFSAKWEPGESLPTLAFGNYLDWPVDREQIATCADNELLRPDGDRYGAPTPLAPGWCTLSILFTDWDGSGRFDLRVANDRHYYIDGSEQLWRVAAGEEPRLYTEADGWDPLQIWGMGIAGQDVTGDRLPELFITSQGDNKLQALEAGPEQPAYDDIAIRWGVTAHRPYTGDDIQPSTAWHPEFQDVNNDGFVDLFITKGNVEAMPEYAMADPNNLLLGQADGTFEEAGLEAGLASIERGRGAALADFNLDGWLDVIVVNRVRPAQIWQSSGGSERWLAVQLIQPAPNTEAIGARIEVKVGEHMISREVIVGGGHAGDQLGWLHFGLGESPVATVRIIWPDGEVLEMVDVKADSFVTIGSTGEMAYWDHASS